ncbi:putative transcriptional regulator [Streptomyces sulfonofaciens]|uniref:Transcriptional regulator n=1 Tax=Streptomyces sulfonofaciens TaxID=68272 RepID=A0A919L7Q5_9ACTN|nr:helix-turn-helix domain-containing protein [Streptomyces sulfonofaciens]GHH85766.1 putative transcriptional regulator [Streptomyces sulfonofaciens]
MRFEERLQDRATWRIGERCSAAKTLDLLSTKTVFLVVRECFYGTSRFDAFVDRTGASAPAVSRALRVLESSGVVERVPYREPGERPRDAYRLTPAGEELLPVLMSLIQWGDKHLQGGNPPLRFTRDGDEEVVVSVTTRDLEPVTSDSILIHAGSNVAEPGGRPAEGSA